MLRRIPILTSAVQREEPPYDKKNNGMPVTGMMPIAIPMFTIT
jgi:hypothetical protein